MLLFLVSFLRVNLLPMRLKLILKLIGKDYTLPCNYMYELSSCLYKILNEGDPEFASWLHDKGYCIERKSRSVSMGLDFIVAIMKFYLNGGNTNANCSSDNVIARCCTGTMVNFVWVMPVISAMGKNTNFLP